MSARRRTNGHHQLGVDASLRHRWWDVPGAGLACAKCGEPKPRPDQPETSCRGQSWILRSPEDLRERKERAVANMLLAWSWVRMYKEGGYRMDPGILKANKAAYMAPLSGLGHDGLKEAIQQVNAHSKQVYRAVGRAPDARIHCMAVAVLLTRLAAVGLLDQGDQASLTGMAILEDVQAPGSDWPPYRPGELGPLSDRMHGELEWLGYFTRPHSRLLH